MWKVENLTKIRWIKCAYLESPVDLLTVGRSILLSFMGLQIIENVHSGLQEQQQQQKSMERTVPALLSHKFSLPYGDKVWGENPCFLWMHVSSGCYLFKLIYLQRRCILLDVVRLHLPKITPRSSSLLIIG